MNCDNQQTKPLTKVKRLALARISGNCERRGVKDKTADNEKHCAFCGKIYYPDSERRKTCSRKCSRDYVRSNNSIWQKQYYKRKRKLK